MRSCVAGSISLLLMVMLISFPDPASAGCRELFSQGETLNGSNKIQKLKSLLREKLWDLHRLLNPGFTSHPLRYETAAPAVTAIMQTDFRMNARIVQNSLGAHWLVAVPNYFDPGDDLLIDTAIRQFFGKFPDRKKIPKIFVGSRSDLFELFWNNPVERQTLPGQGDKLEVIFAYLNYRNDPTMDTLVEFYSGKISKTHIVGDPVVREVTDKNASIKEIIQHLTPELELICQKYNGENLNDPICGSAAPILAALLSLRYKITAKVVSVRKGIHWFVVIPHYYGRGEDILIDPTIRQFFDEDPEFQGAPKIFFGSKEDFVNLFLGKRVNKQLLAMHQNNVSSFISSYIGYSYDEKFHSTIGMYANFIKNDSWPYR